MGRRDQFAAIETQLHKSAVAAPEDQERTIEMFLCIARKLGHSCVPPQTVLDFGCGIGNSVELLLDRGFDAHGVDILELWGKDGDKYWKTARQPDPRVVARLHQVDPYPYVLPFADNTFDFVFSSQVLEHVFDYAAVFSQLARVLKPGAVSVHLFPGPWTAVEPHINVPIIPLCQSRAWLSLWALLGRRSERQYGMPWRQVTDLNQQSMSFNNYPPRRVLTAAARAQGLDVTFAENAYLECSESRPTHIMRRAESVGLGAVVTPILQKLCQRLLVLRKAPLPSAG